MKRGSYENSFAAAVRGFTEPVAQVYVTIENQNFVLSRIIGDGNCLYRSIAHAIYGSQNYHDRVRQETMDYARVNWKRYKHLIQTYYPNKSKSCDEYISYMRRSSIWGGHPEVAMAANFYEIPVHTWNKNNIANKKFYIENPSESAREPIFLCYDFACKHYEVLEIIPEVSIEEPTPSAFTKPFCNVYETSPGRVSNSPRRKI